MDLRRQAVVDIVRMMETVVRVREALEATEVRYAAALETLRTGGPITETLQLSDAGASRQMLTDALQELQQARHAARRVMIQLGRAEGQSIAEMAATWGISRQLVSRYLSEEVGGSGDEASDLVVTPDTAS